MVGLYIVQCKDNKIPTFSLAASKLQVATGYSVEGQGEAGGGWAVCGVWVALWPLPEGFSVLCHKQKPRLPWPLSLQGSIVTLGPR